MGPQPTVSLEPIPGRTGDQSLSERPGGENSVRIKITRLGLFCPGTAPQNPAETGLPYITNYTHEQYGAHPQNWAAAQDRRGVMYFANNGAILEYDGARWRAIPAPNSSIARSVALGPDGVIYVGCQADFGYLTGDGQYISLIDHTQPSERDFKDVWQILPMPDGVYFRADERLLRWSQPGGIRSWKAEKRFHRAYNPGGQLVALST